MQPDDDDDADVIHLGERDIDDGPDLGPDERDRDLMDGSWEQQYYSGQQRTRDWSTIGKGLAILVLVGLLLPVLLVIFR